MKPAKHKIDKFASLKRKLTKETVSLQLLNEDLEEAQNVYNQMQIMRKKNRLLNNQFHNRCYL